MLKNFLRGALQMFKIDLSYKLLKNMKQVQINIPQITNFPVLATQLLNSIQFNSISSLPVSFLKSFK